MAKYSIGIRLHAGYKAARTVKTNLKKSFEFIIVYLSGMEWSIFWCVHFAQMKTFQRKSSSHQQFQLVEFFAVPAVHMAYRLT